jgi:hypothetical protein
MPLSTDTTSATNVAEATRRIFVGLFPDASDEVLRLVFAEIHRLFTGEHPNFQANDIKYHDYRHTLQVTVCCADLLVAHHASDAKPALSARQFELAITAALMHDSGYLKHRGDNTGTGAKYTYCHVLRSCALAASHLPALGFSLEEIDVVLGAIRRTGPSPVGFTPRYRNAEEQFLASAVATADYLAQMAADDYPDELDLLYAEFHESDEFVRMPAALRTFKSAPDLAMRTPKFWAKVVLPKIEKDFLGVYHLLDAPDGSNLYFDAILRNLELIAERAAAYEPSQATAG